MHSEMFVTREKTPNKFVAFWQKIYRPLGFQKGYNFPLCKCKPLISSASC
jgi:hypothetical protein